ncbi:MAG TPA: YraN family protein [Steroidobacteraceae bacterium]|nr:YraN family protein [Steroidobacteraceae bacterium]
MRAAQPPDRQRLGRDAEDAAARFLAQRQVTILARNYRCRTGELDIIAETADGVLVIAEVRLRADTRYGGGAASVDWRKQRRIQRATCHLLARQPALARRAIRFDVLDLAPDGADGYRIEWIRQAFEATPR